MLPVQVSVLAVLQLPARLQQSPTHQNPGQQIVGLITSFASWQEQEQGSTSQLLQTLPRL